MEQRPDLSAVAMAFMRRHGLTRRELAARLGYSAGRAGYNTVTRWFTGKSDPPPCLPLALERLDQILERERKNGCDV